MKSFLFASLAAALLSVPSLHALPAVLTGDTYVDSASATNSGTNGNLRVAASSAGVMKAYLKFDLSTLPTGTDASSITKATLRLYSNANSATFGSVNIYPVTSPWDEATVVNSTPVTLGPVEVQNLAVPGKQKFVAVDVTDLVKDWLSGAIANQGILITPGTGVTSLNLYFNSKEAAGMEPLLDITVGGPLRFAPRGDLQMGPYTVGPQP